MDFECGPLNGGLREKLQISVIADFSPQSGMKFVRFVSITSGKFLSVFLSSLSSQSLKENVASPMSTATVNSN
jgi:hypothetical protein